MGPSLHPHLIILVSLWPPCHTQAAHNLWCADVKFGDQKALVQDRSSISGNNFSLGIDQVCKNAHHETV